LRFYKSGFQIDIYIKKTYNDTVENKEDIIVVFERIREMIKEELNVPEEKITMEARLAEDLGADSIDAVELIMNIEDEFNVQVSDEQAQNIKTVGDIVKYVESVK
jgi:acyl carrier protein